MKTAEARELGQSVAERVHDGEIEQSYALLAPVLAQRTPFRLLGIIGEAVGHGPMNEVNAFLDRIAAEKAEGGWVVIGKALGQQLERDLAGAFARCRDYIVASDVWYGADILGERVPGPALVSHFEAALHQLTPWRQDSNHWVRRAVGVSVHFWAKRSDEKPELVPQARTLLGFLEPMFEEWEMPAAKGVGWGLKTLGKQYPDLLVKWLVEDIVPDERHHRAVMLNKALTYLSEEQRGRVTGEQLP
jgi:3-methyladenine DNA glycosylase AlkD